MFILYLLVLGLCLGSFVNALVWRLHKQEGTKKATKEYSILHGRSMCPHCKHTLHARDLIPVFSWLVQRGRCRYCSEPISWQYPAVELLTSGMFVASYLFWPISLDTAAPITAFVLWLVILTGLVALAVYDIKWMLLPNRIVFPLYYIAAVLTLVRYIDTGSLQTLTDTVLGIAIGGGIFYVLFQVSAGRWIGGGDVKLGFLLGAVVGTPSLALFVLFGASVLGTLYAVPLMALGVVKRSARIPFGPFLIVSAVIAVLFGQSILDWYTSLTLVNY